MVDLNKLVFDTAKIEEFEELVSLYNQLSENIRSKPNWESYKVEVNTTKQLQIFKDIINSDQYIVLTVKYNNEIVGSITLVKIKNLRHAWTRLHVDEFIVKQGYRQQGIGSKIIDWVVNYSRENNIKSVKLMCGCQLTDSHIFYEKIGFKFKDRGYRLEL